MNCLSLLRALARPLRLLAVLAVLLGLPAARATQQGAPVPTPAPLITSFAGPRYGLDGTGPAASFSNPYALAVSRDGRFALIADLTSHTLRRLDLTTNLVTTLAGVGGLIGSTDGIGAAARFSKPRAVAISADGSFALVGDDTGVRRVELATAAVSTIFSGDRLWDLALSEDGSFALVIVDGGTGDYAIKRLDMASSAITLVASFPVGTPRSVVISRDGSFALVSDYSDHVIYRMALPSGTLTLLAGDATAPCISTDGLGAAARLCNALGLSLSSDGSFALFTDNNVNVRRISVADGAVTTIAGGSQGSDDGIGTAARFYNLVGTALAPDDSFALIADGSNALIRRIQLVPAPPLVPDQVTTLAGNLPFGDADGTGTVPRFSTYLAGIALSPDGQFALVADVNGNSIRRLQVADGAVASGTVTTPWRNVTYPNAIAMSADGAFAIFTQSTAVSRLDLQASPPVSPTLLAGQLFSAGTVDATGTDARFNVAYGVALVPDSSVALVADTGNHTIRRLVVATGAVTTFAGSAGQAGSTNASSTTARFNNPHGIVVSADGAFALVADTGNSTIRKIDLATAEVSTLAGSAGQPGENDGTGTAARFTAPTSLALSADGRYALVLDDDIGSNASRVRRVDTQTGAVTTLISADPTLSDDGLLFTWSGGIALSADGSFALVSAHGRNQVRRIGAPPNFAGRVTTLAGAAGQAGSQDGQGLAARFRDPRGVAMSETGIAMVADTGNNTIRRVSIPNGDVFTIAGTGGALGAPGEPGAADGPGPVARFRAPLGVAVNQIATFALVADTGNHAIRRVDLLSGEVTTVAGQLGAAGQVDGPAAQSGLRSPAAVAIAPGGAFALVADTGNHTLRRLDFATGQLSTIVGAAGQAGATDGGPEARLNAPYGVSISCDASFALVTETGSTVRRVALATAQVRTVYRPTPSAGSLAQLGTRPVRVTVVAGDDIGLAPDPESDSVGKLVLANGELVAVAGTPGQPGTADGFGTGARLNQPSDVAAACTSRRVLILDSANQTLRPFDLDGVASGPPIYLPMLRR